MSCIDLIKMGLVVKMEFCAFKIKSWIPLEWPLKLFLMEWPKTFLYDLIQ